MVKRFNERELRDCDGDWFSTGMEETSNGKWCLFSEVEKQNELLKEVAEALDDLVFECDGVFNTRRPTRATYNKAFYIMQKYREQEEKQCGK